MPKLKKEEPYYLLIIGSVARNQGTSKSDLDVVEIGEPPLKRMLLPAAFKSKKPINKISYSYGRFLQLYKKGGLFLYHVFHEGLLIVGDSDSWEKLSKGYKVKKSFRIEIGRSKAVLGFLMSDEQHALAPIAFLSNMLRAMKQIAMCRMAEKGRYVFEKRLLLTSYYPWLPQRIMDAMLDAELVISRKGNITSRKRRSAISAAAVELFTLCSKNKGKLK